MNGPLLPTSPDDQPPDSSAEPRVRVVPIERVETLLACGEITMHGSMLWGSNYAALATLRDAELQATAVYKPQRGERPLWDFPDGTLCRREVASYVVSQALGWQLVPPTVLRQGPHGLGSFQLFIDHDPQVNYFSLDDRFMDELQRFAIFDYLVNNTDRKGGHLLLDTHGKLWGIDHGLTFHVAPKLRTVIWEFAGQRIPDDMLQAVHQLGQQITSTAQPVRRQLNPLISPAEIEALQRRLTRLLERKTFPKPGPGPNHPWPPI